MPSAIATGRARRRSSRPSPAATAEPVIVVVLHRRIRELLELLDRLAAGRRTSARPGGRWGSTARSGRNGWRSRRRRWTIAELSAALDGLLELDAVVKGAPGRGGSEAARRMAFTLWIADHVGRSGVRRPPGVSARRGARGAA